MCKFQSESSNRRRLQFFPHIPPTPAHFLLTSLQVSSDKKYSRNRTRAIAIPSKMLSLFNGVHENFVMIIHPCSSLSY
ncbi:hypothetical protein Y032_0013g1977 [Ancylostoma ceylanicum]|uniref:Uncharacterized protein n=1 Tax=Ancylostoma ceylanicum TaxID=53326 RepID=A0A016VAB5_9BILA|nr:hypothetical protein Y032_0013g1977 [Ancylostoma ceylanicum]